MNRDEDRDPFSARHSYNTHNAPFMSIQRPPVAINTPIARTPVAMWAGGFASTAATPLPGAFATSIPDMPGQNYTQQPPTLDYGGNGGYGGYGSYGGFGDPSKPQPQPEKWAEGKENEPSGTK